MPKYDVTVSFQRKQMVLVHEHFQIEAEDFTTAFHIANDPADLEEHGGRGNEISVEILDGDTGDIDTDSWEIENVTRFREDIECVCSRPDCKGCYGPALLPLDPLDEDEDTDYDLRDFPY